MPRCSRRRTVVVSSRRELAVARLAPFTANLGIASPRQISWKHELDDTRDNSYQDLKSQSAPNFALKSIDSPVLSHLTTPTVSATADSFTANSSLTDYLSETVKMKHLAAYLLLGLAGNSSPSAEDIKGVLSAVGVEADDERLSSLLSELEGKDINEVRLRVVHGRKE